MKNATHTFTFLGTGAGCGVPAFFCSCAACEEARTVPLARRGCCGVLVEGQKRLLIDTPPDLRHQLLRENISSVDSLLFTHAHYDHVSGLGELEYFVRLKRKSPLPLRGSAQALESINKEFGYLTECFSQTQIVAQESFSFDGITYTALPATHAPGTFGFLLESPNTSLFYASDTGSLCEETRERVMGVDICVLDATFWKKSWMPESHFSAQEAIEEGLGMGVGTLYLTHLSMHYDEPITCAGLEDYLAQYDGQVKLAYDGLRLNL